MASRANEANCGLLRNPQFVILASARATTFLGDFITPVVVPFAVIELGGGATAYGVVVAVYFVVQVVSSLFGGVLADRVPRRTVLVLTNCVQFAATTTVVLLLLAHQAETWHIAILEGIFGMGMAVNGSAFSATLVEIVEPGHLQAANGYLSILRSVAMVVGPGVGGALVLLDTASLGFIVDAGVFLVSIILVVRLRRAPAAAPRNQGDDDTAFFEDLAVGWGHVRRRRWFWMTLIGHGLINLTLPASMVLGAVIVSGMHDGALSWGLVNAAAAAGMLAGGAVMVKVRIRRPLLCGGLAAVLLAPRLVMLATRSSVWVLMIGFVLAAFAIAVINDTFTTVIASLIPNEVLSRVNSWEQLGSFVMMPLGYVLVGPFADLWGYTPILGFAAALAAVPAFMAVADPALRTLVLDPRSDVGLSPAPVADE